MNTPPSAESRSAARAAKRESGTPTTLGERTTGVTNEQLQKKLQKRNEHILRLTEEVKKLKTQPPKLLYRHPQYP